MLTCAECIEHRLDTKLRCIVCSAMVIADKNAVTSHDNTSPMDYVVHLTQLAASRGLAFTKVTATVGVVMLDNIKKFHGSLKECEEMIMHYCS